jgi:hypothetical protein
MEFKIFSLVYWWQYIIGIAEYDSDNKPFQETVKPMVDGGTEGFEGYASHYAKDNTLFWAQHMDFLSLYQVSIMYLRQDSEYCCSLHWVCSFHQMGQGIVLISVIFSSTYLLL